MPSETQPRALKSQDRPPQRKASKRKRQLVPEAAIQQLISDWLTVAGIPHAVTDAAVYPGEHPRVTPGFSDLVACWLGRFVAIEVKRLDGRVRPEQALMLADFEAGGAVVIIARSLEDVVETFAAQVPRPAITGSSRTCDLWRAIDAYRKGHGAK